MLGLVRRHFDRLEAAPAWLTGMSDWHSRCPRPAPDYNEAVVRKFVIATVFWAVVAFLVGVWIATELAWPQFNLGLSFINFGRLRPVHTSAAIFAFGGSRAVRAPRSTSCSAPAARGCSAARRSPTSCSGATSSSSSWRRCPT